MPFAPFFWRAIELEGGQFGKRAAACSLGEKLNSDAHHRPVWQDFIQRGIHRVG